MSEILGLSFVRTDGGTQARARLDEAKVAEYMEIIEAGEDMPPVEVVYDGEAYWLWDGFHRVEARRRLHEAGKRSGAFAANVTQGTRRDAVLLAAGANATHGLPRTADDKRRAVETLLRDEEWATWSDREIARRCRVSPTFVGKIRGEVVTVHVDSEERTYVTRHGNTAVMNTKSIGQQVRVADAAPTANFLRMLLILTVDQWHNERSPELRQLLKGQTYGDPLDHFGHGDPYRDQFMVEVRQRLDQDFSDDEIQKAVHVVREVKARGNRPGYTDWHIEQQAFAEQFSPLKRAIEANVDAAAYEDIHSLMHFVSTWIGRKVSGENATGVLAAMKNDHRHDYWTVLGLDLARAGKVFRKNELVQAVNNTLDSLKFRQSQTAAAQPVLSQTSEPAQATTSEDDLVIQSTGEVAALMVIGDVPVVHRIPAALLAEFGEKISASALVNNRVAGIVEYDNCGWVCTGGLSHGPEWRYVNAIQAVSPDLFEGVAINYDIASRRGIRGEWFYHGQLIKHKGVEYVLVGPGVRFEPEEQPASEPTPVLNGEQKYRSGFPRYCPEGRNPVCGANCQGCSFHHQTERGTWQCHHAEYQNEPGTWWCEGCDEELSPNDARLGTVLCRACDSARREAAAIEQVRPRIAPYVMGHFRTANEALVRIYTAIPKSRQDDIHDFAALIATLERLERRVGQEYELK